MSVDTLESRDGRSCLIDTTTGLAFGPVFDRNVGAGEVCEYVQVYMGRDPRKMSADELSQVAHEIDEIGADEFNRRMA